MNLSVLSYLKENGNTRDHHNDKTFLLKDHLKTFYMTYVKSLVMFY